MKRGLLLPLAAAAAAMLACSITSPPPAATPSPSPSPTPTSAPPTTVAPTGLPSGAGPCQPTPTAAFDVYSRPSLAADVFGTFSPDFPPVTILGLTADGWLGFDPGVAQAANIGVFRLRWIPPGAPITLSGDCASVPVEPWLPAAGVCYQMSMESVEVHAAADSSSAVLHTLDVGDFVAVAGRTPAGWLYVNGDDGNVPGVVGFIPEAAMNANGPCESIPEISP